MARKQIFSVGFSFPGNIIENISFLSDRSLLDADVILFQPSYHGCVFTRDLNGMRCLSEESSFRMKQHIRHWKSELHAAVEAGKIVILYLARPEKVLAYPGEEGISDLNTSIQTILDVAPIHSYDTLPFSIQIHERSGTRVLPNCDAQYLTSYWNEFGEHSPYQVTVEGEFTDVLLKTRSGDRIVGATIRQEKGAYLLLPPVDFDMSDFADFDRDFGELLWNDKGNKFGNRLASAIAALVDAFSLESDLTPPPEWLDGPQYRLQKEDKIEIKLKEKRKDIEAALLVQRNLESELNEAGSLRRLLYEKGKPLEAAVIDALELLGFKAEGYDDGESEFDAIFTSSEGRFLGEIEGKDRRWIDIGKLSQLERNIQEDFARDDVTEYATGVLFGNAFRLKPPAERGDTFTTKCLSGARRSKIALVRTSDLFLPAKYLKENDDPQYSQQCREAILNASGDVVSFPPHPDSTRSVLKGPKRKSKTRVG